MRTNFDSLHLKDSCTANRIVTVMSVTHIRRFVEQLPYDSRRRYMNVIDITVIVIIIIIIIIIDITKMHFLKSRIA
jgi:heme/copper-type cytochrome/quinol oxidase subunit 2